MFCFSIGVANWLQRLPKKTVCFWLAMGEDIERGCGGQVLDKEITCFTCSHGNYMFYVKTLESVDLEGEEERVHVLEREKPVCANELRAALLSVLAGREEEEQRGGFKKLTRVEQLGLDKKQRKQRRYYIFLGFVFFLAIVILAIVLVLLILSKTNSKFALW